MNTARNKIDVHQLCDNTEFFELRRRALVGGKTMTRQERSGMYEVIRQRCYQHSNRGANSIEIDMTMFLYDDDHCMFTDSELTDWLIADGLEVAVKDEGRVYVLTWTTKQEVKNEFRSTITQTERAVQHEEGQHSTVQ